MKTKNLLIIGLMILSYITNIQAQTWNTLGSGVNGYVSALVTDTVANILYAEGIFTTAGGKPVKGIAKWDGATWSKVGTDSVEFGNGAIAALTMYKGELYTGGTLTKNGKTVLGICKWNGTNWALVGNVENVVAKDFAILNNELYVCQLNVSTNILKWNGSKWDTIVTDMNVWALAVYKGELYVGGTSTSNYIKKWDGKIWTTIGTADAYIEDLMEYNVELIVAGQFSNVSGVAANRIAKWNGTTWSNVGTGIGGIQATVLSIYHGELIVGGQFSNAGGNAASNIAKWNGSKWSSLGTGVDQNSAVSCMANYNGELIVGGGFSTAGTTIVNNIARWNDGTGIPNENGNSQSISVYPNPAKDKTIIEYTLPQGSSKGELVVYNLQGQEVKRVAVSSGSGKVEFNSGELQAGTYIYQLKGESFLFTKKMVIIK